MPARTDVVIVGAGLAGLSAAVTLTRAGVEVCVLERGDAVGGRVRTDRRDGLLLDRGFQLLNPSYPAVQTMLDVGGLDLHPFEAGVVVARGEGRAVVADPRHSPRRAVSTLTGPGGLREKLALVRWAAAVGYGDPGQIIGSPDEPYADTLRRNHLDGPLTHSVLEPFLAGVLGEDQQQSSRRFVELVLRSFVRGTPALPATGMQAIPEQLAARLPDDVVRLQEPAESLDGGVVVTTNGRIEARAVLVATDGTAAHGLLGLPTPPQRALTTFYHLAGQPPTRKAILHVDGDRRGPVVNSAVVSNVAPSYCADGRALVATTVLGDHDDAETERSLRQQLRWLYGCDPTRWELVATYAIPHALPAMLPPLTVRQSVALGDGRFVAGDHRDTASIQGALVSGRRAAQAILDHLGHPGRKEHRAC
ncbi:NAD(P)/FAD-dependent oxidoreductase [Angustibacter sp. Root456]|uniref:NAD(P)/FAD-dependent oxidoreductase n=1 Tax=Angustibacter sp. Root456 TaxID=1736539 RepID=UPI0006F7BC97|nr:NAD(P)/FAD-dependent oxidoreductase [Angustibacter sp. Root456]KQX64486.1 hypothetical protein ASD06_10000 [Angustibacter sp. Root456]